MAVTSWKLEGWVCNLTVSPGVVRGTAQLRQTWWRGGGLCCLSLVGPASCDSRKEQKLSFPWADYEDCEALQEQSILSGVYLPAW